MIFLLLRLLLRIGRVLQFNVPNVCAPLLLVDTNARFEQQLARCSTADAAPTIVSATCLRNFAAAVGLHISAQFGAQCSAHPNAKRGSLTMSGAPWPGSLDISLVGNVDFDDLHADRDHFPVSRSYLSRSGCHGLRSPHPDPGSHHATCRHPRAKFRRL